MSRRTQTVVYDVGCHRREEDAFGGVEVSSGAEVYYHRPVDVGGGHFRAHSFRMARNASTGAYDTSATPTVRQSVRGGALVVEWAAIELHYSAPTGTTVRARLHDGTSAYYWTGAAWASAESNWNTPAEVVANFAAFPVATATSLTVQWELSTTDEGATPLVRGFTIAARLMFASRSGTTAAGTRSDGWTDDLVHRVLIPWLAQARTEMSLEKTATAEVAALDFSNGFGECPAAPNSVQAVYDLDSDSLMRSPLAGSWDSGALTWTPTTPIASGTRYLVRADFAPTIAYQGDQHLFVDSLPGLIVESVDGVDDRGYGGDEMVRDIANGTALVVPKARKKVFRATILAQAVDAVSAMDLYDAIERLMGGRTGAHLISSGTGMPVAVQGPSLALPARGDQDVGAAARFALVLTTAQFSGPETEAALVTEVTFTVPDHSVRVGAT